MFCSDNIRVLLVVVCARECIRIEGLELKRGKMDVYVFAHVRRCISFLFFFFLFSFGRASVLALIGK